LHWNRKTDSEIPLGQSKTLTSGTERGNLGRKDGRCDRVSLTGAVAFEKVAKVRKRQVQLERDPILSVRTHTCQTVRMTIRAGISHGVERAGARSVLMIW